MTPADYNALRTWAMIAVASDKAEPLGNLVVAALDEIDRLRGRSCADYESLRAWAAAEITTGAVRGYSVPRMVLDAVDEISRLRRAVLDEREACAKVADECDDMESGAVSVAGRAIRRRSQTPAETT